MTKKLEIFKTGTHTSAAGDTIAFSESDIEQTASVYNPALHEAPIVVGHPKSNGPAYGWIKSLSFSAGSLEAEPQQVDPDFEEMVNAGRFKKISASFYAPNSPQNPTPGAYYLRHVGFLGAQPPAVKGMRDAAFSEDEEGVIEFSEAIYTKWGFDSIARVLQRMREYIIERDGVEAADKQITSYDLDEIKEAAKDHAPPPQVEPVPTPDFNEPQPEERNMDPKQLEKALAEQKAANEQLQKQVAEFAEREEKLKAQERKQAAVTATAAIESLVTKGQILPAQKAALTEFALQLDDSIEFEFSEGESTQKVGQRSQFIKLLEQLPKQIEFEEIHDDDDEITNYSSAEALSQAAVEYQEDQFKKGRSIDIVTAINEIQAK